jgi:hypothetical protein
MVMTALDQLNAALNELNEWIAGDVSNWNDVHGSVTGDYENQAVSTANADNAQKIALAAKVNALTLMVWLDNK